jgi:hypothetical protein
MLPIKMKKHWIEKRLGLPAGGSGRNNDVVALLECGTDSLFLMMIQRAVGQKSLQEPFVGLESQLLKKLAQG